MVVASTQAGASSIPLGAGEALWDAVELMTLSLLKGRRPYERETCRPPLGIMEGHLRNYNRQ